MTPTEVWNKFDPSAITLDNSTTSAETEDRFVCVKQYFNAQNNAQSSMRAYMEIFYDKNWTDAHPAILLLDSYENSHPREMARKLVENGYIVGVLDYCGSIFAGEDKTTFSPNLTFASYPECKEYLHIIRKNARLSPWFIWSKMARHALCVIELLPITDKERIGIMGFGAGAHVSWQVAGTDGRIRAIVAVGDTGYRWAKGKAKFTDTAVMDDEALVFSTGVGAETYAKFIDCPTLLVVAKSAYSTDTDRAGDLLSLVQTEYKQLLITNGNDTQLTKSAFDVVMLWLSRNFVSDPQDAVKPTAVFENIDGKLYLRFDTVRDASSTYVEVCYGEPSSNTRHWEPLGSFQKIDAHLYTVNVPVYDENELIVAYVSVTYGDKMVVSTPIQGTIPANLGIKATDRIRDNYRLMYEGNMGLGSFTCLTKDVVADEDALMQAEGPFDIKGITVRNGGISLCRSVAELKALDRTSALHFDAYSPKACTLRINLYAFPEMKRYSAYAQLKGGEFWQKILLQSTDFKSDESKTLSHFGNTKILSVPELEGVILNNFLWI